MLAENFGDAESEDSVDLMIVYFAVAATDDGDNVHSTTPPGPSLLLPEKATSDFPAATRCKSRIMAKGDGETSRGCAPPRRSTRYSTLRPPLNALNSAVSPDSSRKAYGEPPRFQAGGAKSSDTAVGKTGSAALEMVENFQGFWYPDMSLVNISVVLFAQEG